MGRGGGGSHQLQWGEDVSAGQIAVVSTPDLDESWGPQLAGQVVEDLRALGPGSAAPCLPRRQPLDGRLHDHK